MRRLLLGLTAALLALACLAPTAHATTALDDVSVSVEPRDPSIDLGDSIDLAISVTNTGSAPTEPLVVHLDVTDPEQSTSVDPEDWTPTLSKKVGVLAPGGTTVVGWTIQPISGGTFAAYAVALSAGVDRIAASNVVQVAVADRRSLNPGGILPVAVAAPSIIGLLLLLQIRRARGAGPREPARTQA